MGKSLKELDIQCKYFKKSSRTQEALYLLGGHHECLGSQTEKSGMFCKRMVLTLPSLYDRAIVGWFFNFNIIWCITRLGIVTTVPQQIFCEIFIKGKFRIFGWGFPSYSCPTFFSMGVSGTFDATIFQNITYLFFLKMSCSFLMFMKRGR